MEELQLPTFLNIPSKANYSLPDDSLLSFYNDIEERIFWINDEINIYSLDLVHYILKWNREDKNIPPNERKPIKLLIHSPGGDLDILGVLSDIIAISNTPIVGINLGTAYSAAGLVLLACHKRYGLKNSTVLFHKGSCSGLNGSYEEVQSFIKEYQKQVEELSKIIEEKTQFSREEIDEKMKSDWYVNAKECVEKGVYDGIITSIAELY